MTGNDFDFSSRTGFDMLEVRLESIERTISKKRAIIRPMETKDIAEITHAFEQIGWNKPTSQYERYLFEQRSGLRDVYVASINECFAGYLTVVWISQYRPFRVRRIPEIVDLNVLPPFRRMGMGTQLMDRAEHEIRKITSRAGIGVGLTADYGAAQQLYVLRGYIPDGLGLYWKDHHIHDHEEIVVDDDLALYLTKELK